MRNGSGFADVGVHGRCSRGKKHNQLAGAGDYDDDDESRGDDGDDVPKNVFFVAIAVATFPECNLSPKWYVVSPPDI